MNSSYLVLNDISGPTRSPDFDPFPGFPFVTAWIHGEALARSLFENPNNLMHANEEFFAWTPQELEELIQFNLLAGNTEGVALAHKLVQGGVRTAVTGQQPNLLAAPIYNLAKALGVIQEANRLSVESGETVIPVFWVASDDTDFQELRAFQLADRDGRWHSLGQLVTRGPQRMPGSPASDWVLDSQSQSRLVQAAQQVLSGSPGRDSAVQWMKSLFAESQSIGVDGASYEVLFMRSLLSSLRTLDAGPLLFVAPRLSALRRGAVSILLRDLQIFPSLAQQVKSKGESFERNHWPLPLIRPEDAPNFFYHDSGRRLRIRHLGDQIYGALQHGTQQVVRRWTFRELEAHIPSVPGDFSPGVLSRPVIQDHVLRPLVYLAGPGEMAYLAQIHGPTGMYGVSRAAVQPRPTLTVRLPDQAAVDADPTKMPPWWGELDKLRLSAEAEVRRILAECGEFAETAPVEKAKAKTVGTLHRALERLKVRLDRQARQAGIQMPPGQGWRDALARPLGGAQERVFSWPMVLAVRNAG